MGIVTKNIKINKKLMKGMKTNPFKIYQNQPAHHYKLKWVRMN